MATRKEKDLIIKLDKEIALVKKDITVLRENHLKHLVAKIIRIERGLWSVGFAVFANLLILVRDLLF